MGVVWHPVWHLVWHTHPPAWGGGRPVRMYPCGKAPRPARGPDDQPHRAGPIRDALLRAFLVIGDISAACAWTWPGVFPKADPVAVLVRYHTPNVYAAVVAWYDVAPGVAVFLTGQFLISTSRIWCVRMGVSLGLRSRLPAQQTQHRLALAPGRKPTPTAAPGGRSGRPPGSHRRRFLIVLPHLDTPPARTLSQSSV